MPLLYPDLAISQLAYIKRVAGNLFYDYGKVGNQLYRSTGVEAVFDLNFLHFPYNFRLGVRYAYRIDFGNARIQPFVACRCPAQRDAASFARPRAGGTACPTAGIRNRICEIVYLGLVTK